MALEIDWQGKKAYLRIEGVLIRKGRVAFGPKSGGGGPGAVTPEYGMSVTYTIYEDEMASKAISQGQYLGEFDSTSSLSALAVAYGELKAKVKDLMGAKDV